jgi:hypothetical protein
VTDEDAEWLLDEVDDRGSDPQDALSGLSKESREVLASIGLGGPRNQAQDEDQDVLEEEIKVRFLCHSVPMARIVTSVDLLHFKNTFPVIPIHHRTSSPRLSSVIASVPRQGRAT